MGSTRLVVASADLVPGEPGARVTSDETCVFCRKHPVDPRWQPFCSRRCQLLDLARWAEGSYRIPGSPVPPPDDDPRDDRD